MVTLNYRDGRPLYSQIVDGLSQQITAGILQPGDRLPSVRELASQLAINPITIQRAYRELEAGGWVESQAGRGCYVKGLGQGETEALLKTFDDTVAALEAMGISAETLMARLRKGGNDHA